MFPPHHTKQAIILVIKETFQQFQLYCTSIELWNLRETDKIKWMAKLIKAKIQTLSL